MEVKLFEMPTAPTAGVMTSTVLFVEGFAVYGLLALLGGYGAHLLGKRITNE